MLKFLTNKLKTHRINDGPFNPAHHHFKLDEERDSGTESDDEQADLNDYPLTEEMESETSLDRSSSSTISPGPTICTIPSPYFLDSALASDSDLNNDHHSSEEELEVINAGHKVATPSHTTLTCTGPRATRSASVSALPEKRKWAEMSLEGLGVNGLSGVEARLCVTPGLQSSGGSSDDEVQGLLAAIGAPVQFRTSPPQDVLKPGQSLSPPPKLFHYEVSPRKRHRHMHRPHHLQRPCLDFEKMQQLKARAVTAWRHNGEHGGELSVFCW